MQQWKAALEVGAEVEDLMRGITRAMPGSTAERLLKSLTETWGSVEPGGVCKHGDEQEADLCLRQWLTLWKANPEGPGKVYADWIQEQKEKKR